MAAATAQAIPTGEIMAAQPNDLVEQWRLEANAYERDGLGQSAALLRRVAEELQAALRHQDEHLVTIREAAKISGYSAEHLRRLARGGILRAVRGRGSRSHFMVRPGDLPKKVTRTPANGGGSQANTYNPEEDARDIAQLLEGQR